MVKLFVGTAGWSYIDWVPSFYPKKQSKKFDWLRYYSEYFNVVEVNASYYTYLNPRIIDTWLNKVEGTEDFSFTIKLHKDFTHKRNFGREQIKAVQYNLDKLKDADRLGGLLIQFPYSFYYTASNIEYLNELLKTFDNYSKFVEVRHSAWNNSKTYDSLKECNTTLCTIDQPQIGEAVSFNPVVVNKKAYIRFHGRNEEAWKNSINNFGKKQTYEEQNARYNYLYSPDELIEIESKIKEYFDELEDIFVIMNNHPKGDAVANAFELIHLLNERNKVKIPPTILSAYPRLKRFAELW